MAARTRTPSLALLLLAAGCHDATPAPAPPLDRFYFPTSIALRHVDASGAGCIVGTAGCVPCTGGTPGCVTQLLVASSNFDLRYDPASGGTVLAVDVERALVASPPTAAPVLPADAILGSARMGSFTGELAVLDETTCPGWDSALGRTPQVLVTSRSQNALYRIDLAAGGALDCGPSCKVPLEPTLADAYGTTVVCGNYPGVPPSDGSAPDLTAKPQYLAYVSYLRAPDGVGWLSRLDLTAPFEPTGKAARTQLNLGFDPIANTVFDAGSGLLFATARFGTLGNAPLRAYQLAAPQVQAITVNLFDAIRGAELTGLALSSDATRAYVTLRIYDADLATSLGGRPGTDLAAALAVIDVKQLLSGVPAASALLRVVPVDRGASAVRSLARAGRRDLVALASPDDGSVTFYDDQTGTVAQVLGACGGASTAAAPPPCLAGDPSLGKQPFALAFEPFGAAQARLFIASFDRSWIDVLTLDPTQPSLPPSAWQRIGPERP